MTSKTSCTTPQVRPHARVRDWPQQLVDDVLIELVSAKRVSITLMLFGKCSQAVGPHVLVCHKKVGPPSFSPG